jgi:HlyD family secretion protein
VIPLPTRWRKRRMRDRTSFRAAGLFLLAGLVVGAAVLARDATLNGPAPRACETAMVTSGPLVGTLRLPGRLSVESAVRIGAGQPGLVLAAPAAVGAQVRKGEVLARLDDVEQRAGLAAADTQLASAELLAVRAERALESELRRQLDEGLIPALPDADELLEGMAGDAQLEYWNGAAQVLRRKQALRLARQLLERRVVRSPIDGIVLARNIAAGESIPASPPGPPLFVIGSDPSRLRLDVEVDERYLNEVLPGPASFTVPAYGRYAFPATIRSVEISPGASRSPAPHVVTLEVANADGTLQPGMSAIVELAMASGRDAITVPTGALSGQGEATVAWLAGNDGQRVAVPVRVGISSTQLTEVDGAGIAAGRVVITDRSPSTCRLGSQASQASEVRQ